jgi:hypothetical protein
VNGSGTADIHRDHNDWANLIFPFAAVSGPANGVSPARRQYISPTIVNDVQPVAAETPPPSEFFEWLRARSAR